MHSSHLSDFIEITIETPCPAGGKYKVMVRACPDDTLTAYNRWTRSKFKVRWAAFLHPRTRAHR